jgi:hypothetical protein
MASMTVNGGVTDTTAKNICDSNTVIAGSRAALRFKRTQ